MSYDSALAQWTTQTGATAPPTVDRVISADAAGLDPSLVDTARAWWIRACMAVVVLGFVAMAALEFTQPAYMRNGRSVAAILPIASMLMCMRWIRVRELGKQMLVRALVWSTLVIGVLLSTFGFHPFATCGIPISLGAGAALLLLDGKGLGVSSAQFRPTAFRNHLLIALVLATADAQTLLFSAAVQLGSGYDPLLTLRDTLPSLACGGLMAAAVVGIYKLRTWALLLNLVANVGIAYLAMSGVIGLSLPVASALAATATVQLLLPVPILAAALGDPLRDRSPLGRYGGLALRVSIVLVMLAGCVGRAMPETIDDGLGFIVWRTGWAEDHRNYIRGSSGGVYRPAAVRRGAAVRLRAPRPPAADP
jgi:hypothetical protein